MRKKVEDEQGAEDRQEYGSKVVPVHGEVLRGREPSGGRRGRAAEREMQVPSRSGDYGAISIWVVEERVTEILPPVSCGVPVKRTDLP